MSRDLNHYFRQSARLKNYDYSKSGAYFITITVDREGEIFGKIVEGKIKLNKSGEIIKQVWMNLPKQFAKVKLDEFVVMPDHLHGIVVIKESKSNKESNSNGEGLMNQARTKEGDWILMKNEKDTLGEILRSFKAKAAKLIREDGFKDFKWHRNYYDHIARDDKDLLIIRKYIKNNPLK
jgi:REP element-mobilizing transposase RayT